MQTESVVMAKDALADKNAQDLQIIDLRPRSTFTDYFLLATGLSSTHTKALAAHLENHLAGCDLTPFTKEGFQEGKWILLDYLDFVVHIFTPEARDYYQLERLWRQENQ